MVHNVHQAYYPPLYSVNATILLYLASSLPPRISIQNQVQSAHTLRRDVHNHNNWGCAMLQNLLHQINQFIAFDEKKTAYEVLNITLKFLYQAKPHQLQGVSGQDLVTLYNLIEHLKDTKSDIGFLASNYVYLLEVVERLGSKYSADPDYLRLRANLKQQQGRYAPRDSYAASISKNGQAVKPTLIHSQTRQMLDDTGVKFKISALRDFENSKLDADIATCKHELDTHELKTWQRIIHGDVDVAATQKTITRFVEQLAVSHTTTLAEWQQCFAEAKQFMSGLSQHHTYEAARQVLTYPVHQTPGRQCPEFNIQDLCTTLETINRAQLSSTEEIKKQIHHEQPLWQRHREQLKQMRETAKAQLEKGLDIQFVQQGLRRVYLDILKDIFANAEKLLGPSPVPYVFSVSGSLSRGDGSPFSDIEAMIIAAEKNKAFLNYIDRVLRIVNYEMELIGENNANEAAGFHLDAAIRVVSADDLETMGIESVSSFPGYVRETMSEDIARLKPNAAYVSGGSAGNVASVGNVVSAVGTESAASAEFFKQVQQAVPTLERAQIMKFLSTATAQFDAEKPKLQSHNQVDALAEPEFQVNIKKAYIQPIGVICSALAQLYQLPVESSGHPLDILLILSGHRRLDKKFAEALRSHLSWLYETRMRYQLERGLGPDTGMDIISCDPDSEEAKRFAQIDAEVVQPLQKLIKWLESEVKLAVSSVSGLPKEDEYPVGLDGLSFTPNVDRDKVYYAKMGKELRDTNKLADAIPYLNTALALDPKVGNAYGTRGVCNNRLKKYELAIFDITNALEYGFNGKIEMLLYNRGGAYKALGLYNSAIDDYTAAIGISPNDGDFFLARADAYVKLQKIDLALLDFAKAIEFPATRVAAYYNRANLYSKLNRYDDALSDYVAAIKIDPKKWDAHWNRANLLSRLDRNQEAFEGFKKLLELNPQEINAYQKCSDLLKKLDRAVEAAWYIEKFEALKHKQATNVQPILASSQLKPIAKEPITPISLGKELASTSKNPSKVYKPAVRTTDINLSAVRTPIPLAELPPPPIQPVPGSLANRPPVVTASLPRIMGNPGQARVAPVVDQSSVPRRTPQAVVN
jgi:tetratricopeptide (TPR) repeat protein